MEPLLSHNSDVERNGAVVQDRSFVQKQCGMTGRMPRKCKALLCCSVLLNVLGCLILAFIVFTNQSYQPILPPPPKNASKAVCPFRQKSFDSSTFGRNIVITETAATYLAICWNDLVRDERGLETAPYEIKVDDWWMSKTITQTQPIYRGRAVHLNITDLLPATKYTIQLVIKNGLVKRTYSVTGRTQEAGYCGNEADVMAYKETKSTMKGSIQSCMIGNVFSDSQAQKCIQDKVGISKACSGCWLAEGHCTLKRCAAQCLSPGSKACKECSERRCFPDAVKCSGMPLWSFPP